MSALTVLSLLALGAVIHEVVRWLVLAAREDIRRVQDARDAAATRRWLREQAALRRRRFRPTLLSGSECWEGDEDAVILHGPWRRRGDDRPPPAA